MTSEEEKFEELFALLLMSGEYIESEIEDQVHYIMDNPDHFPEYFK